MTKMEMLERFYERHEELERKLDAAENDGNTRAIEACQKGHQELLEEVRAEGETFGDMMRLYSEMKQQGNSRLDLSGTYRKPEEVIRIFREFGVKEFTFSSTWSSAVETAWLFQKEGCSLEGLVEINSQHQAFMSNEYEKAHGYLFRVN